MGRFRRYLRISCRLAKMSTRFQLVRAAKNLKTRGSSLSMLGCRKAGVNARNIANFKLLLHMEPAYKAAAGRLSLNE